MTEPGKLPFEPANGLIPAPVDQSIIDMLETSPLGPILNTPVNDVLARMGLPPLPAAPPPMPPMPGLPPFPAINIEELFKPLTDLAQSFGTGQLDLDGFDPTTIFSGLSTLMESMVGASSGALKAADQVWQGMSASANTAKSATAAAEGTAVGAKAADVSANTATGAGVVSTGNLTMQGVIAKFMATASVAMASIWTPFGAPALLAAAVIALDEAMIVVTGTKTALAPETAKQLTNATQIPITGAPSTVSPFGVASTVLDSVGTPLTSLAGQGLSSMGTMTKQLTDAHQKQFAANEKKGVSTPGASALAGAGAGGAGKSGGGGGGGAKVGGGAGGGGGVGGVAAPLQARPNMPNLGTPATAESASTSPSTGRATTASSGMMPMGGGGAGAAAARGGEGGEGHGSPEFLVTAEHGSEVVGDLPSAAPSVLGADADTEIESPDIELRL